MKACFRALVAIAFCLLIGSLIGTPRANAQASTPQNAVSPAIPAPNPSTGRKKRIAILDFDYATVQTDSSALFGTNVDVGKGITDLLIRDLVQSGAYSVIDRQDMNKILAEQDFSRSDRADPATAARIGKLLGVDAIIVGAVTQFGDETKHQNIHGGGMSWHGIGFGGIGHRKTKAAVTIDARVVNVDTGEIEAVADGHGESSRSSTSLLGGGGNWRGWGNGAVDFGSSNFQQTIIGEAVNDAVQQLSQGLVQDEPKVQVRSISVNGLVAAVVNGQVVLDVGKKAGVRVGDQLSIQRVTMVIKDPVSHKVLRKMTTPVGVVRVINVDAVSAVAVPVSGGGFKVGDEAKTVTQ